MSAAALISPVKIAPAPQERQLLREMVKGQVAAIENVTAAAGDAKRLKALGLCEGRTVRLVSPGNPLIVQVLGSRVGLSAILADQVVVKSC